MSLKKLLHCLIHEQVAQLHFAVKEAPHPLGLQGGACLHHSRRKAWTQSCQAISLPSEAIIVQHSLHFHPVHIQCLTQTCAAVTETATQKNFMFLLDFYYISLDLGEIKLSFKLSNIFLVLHRLGLDPPPLQTLPRIFLYFTSYST